MRTVVDPLLRFADDAGSAPPSLAVDAGEFEVLDLPPGSRMWSPDFLAHVQRMRAAAAVVEE